MSKRQYLLDLISLRDSFDHSAGLRLVNELLKSEDHRVFNVIAELVIPKWLGLLNEVIIARQEILPDKLMAWLLIKLGGWRLPSIESELPHLLERDDELALAAADYCIDKHFFLEKAIGVVEESTHLKSTNVPILVQPIAAELAFEIKERITNPNPRTRRIWEHSE